MKYKVNLKTKEKISDISMLTIFEIGMGLLISESILGAMSSNTTTCIVCSVICGFLILTAIATPCSYYINKSLDKITNK